MFSVKRIIMIMCAKNCKSKFTIVEGKSVDSFFIRTRCVLPIRYSSDCVFRQPSELCLLQSQHSEG